MKNCEGLGLPTVESKHLDTFIDKLYDDIDRGEMCFEERFTRQ